MTQPTDKRRLLSAIFERKLEETTRVSLSAIGQRRAAALKPRARKRFGRVSVVKPGRGGGGDD
jgi:hypothetical protein